MEHNEQRQQWEYKRFAWRGSDDELEGELNRLGTEGWELVTMAFGGGGWLSLIFKRLKLAPDVPSV